MTKKDFRNLNAVSKFISTQDEEESTQEYRINMKHRMHMVKRQERSIRE